MRLIDADEFPAEHVNVGYDDYGAGFDEGIQIMLDEIKDAPTVDAVHVVRCKHCINRKYCEINWSVDGDWFCADGERKDGEQDG